MVYILFLYKMVDYLLCKLEGWFLLVFILLNIPTWNKDDDNNNNEFCVAIIFGYDFMNTKWSNYSLVGISLWVLLSFLKKQLLLYVWNKTSLIFQPTGTTDPLLRKNKKTNITNFGLLVFLKKFDSMFWLYYFLFLVKTYNDQNQKGFTICQKQPLKVFRRKRCS